MCLQSIQNQSYKNTEIIVVDAFSKDHTQRIAERFDAELFILAAERSPARNFGAKQANGNFLLFVDSDMELDPRVVEECVNLSISRNADAVIIPEESVGANFVAKCKKMEKTMRLREAYGEAPRFFREEVFKLVGGYAEEMVLGEDFELAQHLRNMNFNVGRCDAIIKHHEGSTSIKKLVSKLYFYGKTLPIYLKKEPYLALKTSSPVRFVKSVSLFRRQPTYFTGLCFLKLVEYSAYLAGAFAYVLNSK
jgi:glycosyltransferase involved in cell wall biosynthesis